MPDGHNGKLIQHIIELGLLNYLWFIVLAIWGSTVSYLSKLQKRKGKFSIIELIIEWIVSGFVGAITIMLCLRSGFDVYITGAVVGISGHMGSKAIVMLEVFVLTFAEKYGFKSKKKRK